MALDPRPCPRRSRARAHLRPDHRPRRDHRAVPGGPPPGPPRGRLAAPAFVARALLGVLLALAAVTTAVWAGTEPAGAQYVEPVDGHVVDGFRPPRHFAGPGNRGWEYATVAGSPVRAAGAGVVAFAGFVGSGRYISIDHPDGLRTTYSLVATIGVAPGQAVTAGTVIATTGTTFHFGVRREARYIDPAVLFGPGAEPGPPVLVLRPGRVGPQSEAGAGVQAAVPLPGTYR